MTSGTNFGWQNCFNNITCKALYLNTGDFQFGKVLPVAHLSTVVFAAAELDDIHFPRTTVRQHLC